MHQTIKTKTALLKPCAFLVGAIMLSACQSTPHPKEMSLAKTNVLSSQTSGVRELFSDSKTSPARQNQAQLVDAISRHLASERYSLGTHHHKVMPITTEGTIDEGADTLLNSAIKTYAYKNQPVQTEVFRTKEAYLGLESLDEESALSQLQADDLGQSVSGLPYLRYHDEMVDSGFDSGLTRAEGMSDAYQAAQEEQRGANARLHGDITEISINLDRLVADNPTITTADGQVQAELLALDQLIKNHKKAGNEAKLHHLGGYVSQDFEQVAVCADDFNTSIRQALSASRDKRSYEGDDYHYYDLVYVNYRGCHQIYDKGLSLDPFYYLDISTELELKNTQAQRACQMTTHGRNHDLLQQGKSYAKDAELFAQNFIHQVSCVDAVIGDVFDESYQPKPVQTLASAYAQQESQSALISTYLYPQQVASDTPLSKAAEYFDAYKRMKAEDADNVSADPSSVGGMVGMVLGQLKLTPEQLKAQNIYQNDHTVVTVLGHYQPSVRQSKELYSLDSYAPTLDYSIQVPVMIDYTNDQFKADVSALLPLMAMLTPSEAMLPNDLPNQEMTFGLPDEWQGRLPTAMLYDAARRGLIEGLTRLNDEKITAIDIREDHFAKQIGAHKAYKLDLGSQEGGQIIATIAKHLTKDLKSHIDANASLYQGEQGQAMTRLINDLTLIQKGHHTGDVGKVLQVIEGVLPIGIHHAVQVYLDAKGDVVGIQSKGSLTDHTQQAMTQSIGQIRYSDKPFSHPLATKFEQSFNTNDSFDGTAWLSSIRLNSEAKQARAAYYDDYDDAYDDYGNEQQVDEYDTADQERADF